MVLIPKKNRVAIYSYLFKEGVMVAKESPFAPRHIELEVPNLHVLKEMKSLKSRGYITQQFNWGYYYWYLTNEGIEFLRGYLHLPDDIVPATLKKPKLAPRPAGGARDGERRPPRFDRTPSGGADGEKKVGGPSPGFQPRFGEGGSGGYGRGRAEGGRSYGGDRPGGFQRSSYRSEGGSGGAPQGDRPSSFGRGSPSARS